MTTAIEVTASPAYRQIIHGGTEKNGSANGLVVDKLEIAIMAIEVVSAFSCVPAYVPL